jgi:hypothetical protein
VVAAICQRGVGEESGAATELRYFQVWSFRGGKVIRLEGFRERAEALEAAGLREELPGRTCANTRGLTLALGRC